MRPRLTNSVITPFVDHRHCHDQHFVMPYNMFSYLDPPGSSSLYSVPTAPSNVSSFEVAPSKSLSSIWFRWNQPRETPRPTNEWLSSLSSLNSRLPRPGYDDQTFNSPLSTVDSNYSKSNLSNKTAQKPDSILHQCSHPVSNGIQQVENKFVLPSNYDSVQASQVYSDQLPQFPSAVDPLFNVDSFCSTPTLEKIKENCAVWTVENMTSKESCKVNQAKDPGGCQYRCSDIYGVDCEETSKINGLKEQTDNILLEQTSNTPRFYQHQMKLPVIKDSLGQDSSYLYSSREDAKKSYSMMTTDQNDFWCSTTGDQTEMSPIKKIAKEIECFEPLKKNPPESIKVSCPHHYTAYIVKQKRNATSSCDVVNAQGVGEGKTYSDALWNPNGFITLHKPPPILHSNSSNADAFQEKRNTIVEHSAYSCNKKNTVLNDIGCTTKNPNVENCSYSSNSFSHGNQDTLRHGYLDSTFCALQEVHQKVKSPKVLEDDQKQEQPSWETSGVETFNAVSVASRGDDGGGHRRPPDASPSHLCHLSEELVHANRLVGSNSVICSDDALTDIFPQPDETTSSLGLKSPSISDCSYTKVKATSLGDNETMRRENDEFFLTFTYKLRQGDSETQTKQLLDDGPCCESMHLAYDTAVVEGLASESQTVPRDHQSCPRSSADFSPYRKYLRNLCLLDSSDANAPTLLPCKQQPDCEARSEPPLWSRQNSPLSCRNASQSTSVSVVASGPTLTSDSPNSKQLFKLGVLLKRLYSMRQSQQTSCISDPESPYSNFKLDSLESILTLFSDNILHSMQYVFFPSVSSFCCSSCPSSASSSSSSSCNTSIIPPEGNSQVVHMKCEDKVNENCNINFPNNSEAVVFFDQLNFDEIVDRLSQISGITDRAFLHTLIQWCKEKLCHSAIKKEQDPYGVNKECLEDSLKDNIKKSESSRTILCSDQENPGYTKFINSSDTQPSLNSLRSSTDDPMHYHDQYPEINHMISKLIGKLQDLQRSFTPHNEIHKTTLSSLTHLESAMNAYLETQNETLGSLSKKRLREEQVSGFYEANEIAPGLNHSCTKKNTEVSKKTFCSLSFSNILDDSKKLHNLQKFQSDQYQTTLIDPNTDSKCQNFSHENEYGVSDPDPLGEMCQREKEYENSIAPYTTYRVNSPQTPLSTPVIQSTSENIDSCCILEDSSLGPYNVKSYTKNCLVLLEILAQAAPEWANHRDSYVWHCQKLMKDLCKTGSKDVSTEKYMKLLLLHELPVTLCSPSLFCRGRIANKEVMDHACNEAVKIIFLWQNWLDTFRLSEDPNFQPHYTFSSNVLEKNESSKHYISLPPQLLKQLHFFFRYLAQSWKSYIEQCSLKQRLGDPQLETSLFATSQNTPMYALNSATCSNNDANTLPNGTSSQSNNVGRDAKFSVHYDEDGKHLNAGEQSCFSTARQDTSGCGTFLTSKKAPENTVSYASSQASRDSEHKKDSFFFAPATHATASSNDQNFTQQIWSSTLDHTAESRCGLSPLTQESNEGGTRKRRMMIMVCTARPFSASSLRESVTATSCSVHDFTSLANNKRTLTPSHKTMFTDFKPHVETMTLNPSVEQTSISLCKEVVTSGDGSHIEQPSKTSEASYDTAKNMETESSQVQNTFSVKISEACSTTTLPQNVYESFSSTASTTVSSQNGLTYTAQGTAARPVVSTSSPMEDTVQAKSNFQPQINHLNSNATLQETLACRMPFLTTTTTTGCLGQETAPCPGVLWSPHENAWIAYAPESSNVNHPAFRSFSVAKYGAEMARLLAVQWKNECECVYVQRMLQQPYSTNMAERAEAGQENENQCTPYIQPSPFSLPFSLSGYMERSQESKKSSNVACRSKFEYSFLQGANGIKQSKARAAIRHGTNTSQLPNPPKPEIPGVYWYRNRNGWVAQWFEKGKNKHKFFAASAFGVEGAKEKAIAYRLMKLEEKRLKGW